MSLLPVLLWSGIVLLLILYRLMQQFSPSIDATKALLVSRGYQQMGRMEEALAKGRLAVDLEPENAEAHLFLAYLLIENGDIAFAAEEIERAAALDPFNVAYQEALELYRDFSSKPTRRDLEPMRVALRNCFI